MIVDTTLIESSVLQIFERFRIKAGGRIVPADLRKEWPASRLRMSDLDIGIRECVLGGALMWVETDDGPVLELTALGAEQISQGPALNEATLHRWWLDFRFRLSRSTLHGDPRRAPLSRRYTDGARRSA